MDPEYFEDLVDEAMDELPEEFAARLDNIEIVVKANPSRKLLKQMGMGRDETLLGLYEGVSQAERSTSYGGVMPDRILIFREPILDEADATCPPDAPDEEFDARVREVIRTTVLHEVGHYFGLTDEDLRRLDYE